MCALFCTNPSIKLSLYSAPGCAVSLYSVPWCSYSTNPSIKPSMSFCTWVLLFHKSINQTIHVLLYLSALCKTNPSIKPSMSFCTLGALCKINPSIKPSLSFCTWELCVKLIHQSNHPCPSVPGCLDLEAFHLEQLLKDSSLNLQPLDMAGSLRAKWSHAGLIRIKDDIRQIYIMLKTFYFSINVSFRIFALLEPANTCGIPEDNPNKDDFQIRLYFHMLLGSIPHWNC